MSFDWKDEAFRKLVSMLIHDDEAYSKLQEMADEIERLQARIEVLEGVIAAIKHYCYSGGTHVITVQRIIEQDLPDTEQGEKE